MIPTRSSPRTRNIYIIQAMSEERRISIVEIKDLSQKASGDPILTDTITA
ncbi:hypothetical protein QJQ58_09910 [Paenibacillus dendritiformis]|nr:hypothetical protein [Paenibacillus dendritiformis]WGU96518.1 hypothetical protein QJQ58_09910 [Paenibacillus dendritiformis]